MHSVVVRCNEASSVDEAYRNALEEVRAFLAWPLAHTYVADKNNLFVSADLWSGAVDRFEVFQRATRAARFPVGVGLPGQVASLAHSVWIPDLGADPDFRRSAAAREAGLGAALAFPILVARESIAVLEFFALHHLSPDETILQLTDNVGSQVGTIIERLMGTTALRITVERIRSLIESAGEGFIGMDSAGRITEWNRYAENLFGWKRAEAVGQEVAELIVPDELRSRHRHGLQRYLESRRTTIMNRRVEFRARARDGRELPIELTVWAGEVDQVVSFGALIREVSHRSVLDAELQRLALYDPLTGLPNRTLLLDRLSHALARGRRRRAATTTLLLDLDRFKLVKDIFGSGVGNRLLVEVVERLRTSVRPSDTVARFGEDQFVIVIEDANSDTGLLVAERLRVALAPPFEFEGEPIFMQGSIGLATARSNESTAEELLSDTEVALDEAKREGKGRFAMFETTLRAAAKERLELEADLRRAVAATEFILHYQPVVRLSDGCVVQAEALVRWNRRHRNLLYPNQFIPLAEEAGLIAEVGRWVLREACRQASAWEVELRRQPKLGVSINVSAHQLAEKAFIEEVATTLAETGLAPELLVLEITESVFVSCPEEASEHLRALQELGVQIALDDFGTGYSSLSYLSRYPIDVLKIDKSFVSNLLHNHADAELAFAIVKLAQALGLRSVAEGIESREQLSRLQQFGTDHGQGYFFAKPLSPAGFTEALSGIDQKIDEKHRSTP